MTKFPKIAVATVALAAFAAFAAIPAQAGGECHGKKGDCAKGAGECGKGKKPGCGDDNTSGTK